MITEPLTSPVAIAPAGRFRSIKGPSAVAVATLVMLIWSWGTWTDPLVDFGTQLYIPWQLLAGKVLYRDIAYYNGPLSQYANAGWFAIAGVSLRTLVWANIAVLSLTIVLVYRLARRASGNLAATAAGVAFAIFFAFNQGVGVANFNWVTPYTHEITHGVALGLCSIACISRYHRGQQKRWLFLAGILLGLTFLTKAEPFAAAGLAATVQLMSALWIRRAPRRVWLRTFAALAAFAFIVPLIAVLLFATAMPIHSAIVSVAGSWMWVCNSRIMSLPFYRHVTGFNDLHGNLASLFRWILGYAAVFVPATIISLRTSRPKSLSISAAVFVLVITILTWQFFNIDWSSMIRPLPLFLLLALLVTAFPVVQRRALQDRTSLRIALIVFSIVLLLKIILNSHISHYGFVLAMPAGMVLVAALAQGIPDTIDRFGGSGRVLRAAALAAISIAAAATLYADAGFLGAKQWTIGAGADAFRGDTRALEVQEMTELLRLAVPGNGTVQVFPAGTMLNYLARRTNPTPHINFMPPEVLTAGEDTILQALIKNPPDAIVINSSTVRNNQFTLDEDYTYGQRTIAWIRENYEPVQVVELPPPHPTTFHLMLMRHKPK